MRSRRPTRSARSTPGGSRPDAGPRSRSARAALPEATSDAAPRASRLWSPTPTPPSIPTEVERIALMDAFLPGVGDWTKRLAAAGPLAFPFLRQDAAGAGRRPRAHRLRAFLERLRRRSGALRLEADRQLYAAAYAQPGAHAGRLRALPRLRAGRQGLRRLRRDQLTMPMLVLTGETHPGLRRVLLDHAHGACRRCRAARRASRRQASRPLADGKTSAGCSVVLRLPMAFFAGAAVGPDDAAHVSRAASRFRGRWLDGTPRRRICPAHGSLTSRVHTSRSGSRRSGSPWTTKVSPPTVS